MSDHKPAESHAKSLRAVVAIAGVSAMAVMLGQSVSTLAQTNQTVSTSGSQVATGNFFPTPLVTNVACVTSGGAGARRATISWSPPVPVPGKEDSVYRYRVDWVYDNEEVKYSFETNSNTTGAFRIYDQTTPATAATYRIRVHTINSDDPSVVSSGYRSHSVHSYSIFSTYCTGDPYPETDAPNRPWENTTVWDPSQMAPAAAGQRRGTAVGRSAPVAAVNPTEADDVEAAERNADATVAQTSEPSDETSPNTMTSRSTVASGTVRPSTLQGPTSTATSRPPTTTPSSSETRSTTVPKTTETSTSPSVAATTSSVTQAPASPVRLPSGREAQIVGDTKLEVSGADAPECTAKVRKGSELTVRDGELHLTDQVMTRVVDLETCELRRLRGK